jgi:hypothetical protein
MRGFQKLSRSRDGEVTGAVRSSLSGHRYPAEGPAIEDRGRCGQCDLSIWFMWMIGRDLSIAGRSSFQTAAALVEGRSLARIRSRDGAPATNDTLILEGHFE